MFGRVPFLVVVVAILLAGCAPSLSRQPVVERSIPPFKSGDQWFLYAGGSNIANGDNLMLSVQVPALRNPENNFFYTVGTAESKSSYFYYYPEQDALAVYVFLNPSSVSQNAQKEALLCFTYFSGNAWTGFWVVSTLDKIQQIVERDNITPEGSCSLNRQ